MQFWFGKYGTRVTNKNMISISQVFLVKSFAGKPLSFSDRMITATSFCQFFVENRALRNARDIAVAERFGDIQQHRLLWSVEDPKYPISLPSSFASFLATCATGLLFASVGICRTSGSHWCWLTSHPPLFTKPSPMRGSAPVSSLFAHASSLESCSTLTATAPRSTTRCSLYSKK